MISPTGHDATLMRGGLTDGPWLAQCDQCPFSTAGGPTKPVLSEHPEDPAWLIIGEGPGFNETRFLRPFVGQSGQVVNQVLTKIGRKRETLYLGNATLCQPPQGAPEADRQRAATCCQPRLLAELAQFPGKPILTLGAVAARAVIPQAILDAIDPPETPKAIKKGQKFRAAPMLKNAAQRKKAINKETERQLKKLIDYQRRALITEAKVKWRRRPDVAYLEHEITRVHAQLTMRAREVAIKTIDLRIKERAAKKLVDAAKPKKPKKPKQVKLTDIVGTLFDIDVDGSGPRPLIPGIHPAALLHGGGASIAGSHTPDLAFINLIYDASKIDSLSKGKDIRLKLDVVYEVESTERAQRLFLEAYRGALAEGAVSLDLETYVDDPDRHHALMAYVARIRVVGLATKERSYSFAWELLPGWCMSLLQHLLSRVELTTHNGLYDRTVLRQHGFILPEDLFFDCYIDSETEFLTEGGWKRYEQVESTDRLGTIDSNGALEWQLFSKRVAKRYLGEALVFETQRTRAVVTPNHRMWCRPVRRTRLAWRGTPMGSWGFIRADQMLAADTDSFEILQTTRPIADGIAPCSDSYLKLLGLWISDGHLTWYKGEPRTIIISQVKDGKASALLRELARTFDLRMTEWVRDEAWRSHPAIEERWELHDRQIATDFATYGRHSRERRLPSSVFGWSAHAKKTFLEALFLGDGSERGGRFGRFIYRSGSEPLADAVQALALSLGWSATNPPTYRPDDICHVFISRKVDGIAQIRARTSGKNSNVRRVSVDDRIVCFSVPNETLITRSCGKPAFYGNTLLAHHASFPGVSHRLQTVTSQFFGVGPWKSEFRNAEETADKLADYNARDTGATHALREPLKIHLRRTKTEQVYAQDLKMAEIASGMHIAGMPVDRDINSELLATFSKATTDARRSVEDTARDPKLREQIWHHLALQQAFKKRKLDPDDFEERYQRRLSAMKLDPDWKWKISAGKHIAALLLAMGVGLYQTTDKGEITTKKEILEALTDVAIVREILQFRENDKLLSTFIWQIFDRLDPRTGEILQHGYADSNNRIHPIWNIHRITGRWASQWPVVSNVPKDKWKKLAGDALALVMGIDLPAKGYYTLPSGIVVRRNKDDSVSKLVRPNLRRQIKAPPGRMLVGFDFCLAKGTMIDTPNGAQPIEKLEIGDLVYTFNFQTKRPDCSKITNRVYTGMRRTLKVCLDNGEEVRCTPDHRWLVRPWGSGAAGAVEVQAGDLKPGMRLLPLRRNVAGSVENNNAYETLYSYSAFEYVKTHIVVANAALGSRPAGHDVHHKDGNRFNNQPDNLEYKLKSDHLSEHAKVTGVANWADSVLRAKMARGISKACSARGGHHGSNNPNFGKRTGIDTACPMCGVSTYFGGKHPKKFCSQACYKEFRAANKGRFRRGEQLHDLNHKVALVVDDGLVVPTYDIEVERDHNFALVAGVFVHNCQVEARVIALISGDPFLCAIFAEGRDPHIECSRIIWPHFDTLDPDTRKQLRENVKNIEYGAMYMAQLETLHKTMLKAGNMIKLADLAVAINKLLHAMAGVVRWQHATIAQAAQPPYQIKDFVLGRTRNWPMGQAEGPEAVNFGVQTAAASIMNRGMARIHVRLREYQEVDPIAQIHDAAVFECWEDDAQRLVADLKDCFEQEFERDGRFIPFPIDTKVGPTWADV